MKTCCTILFFLSTLCCFSQTQVINSIHTNGVLLDSGWKFHEGDNPEWSKPNLDDSKWRTVTLSDYNSYIPQLKNKDIGWFRLSLLIDSLAEKKQLAIQLSQ